MITKRKIILTPFYNIGIDNDIYQGGNRVISALKLSSLAIENCCGDVVWFEREVKMRRLIIGKMIKDKKARTGKIETSPIFCEVLDDA